MEKINELYYLLENINIKIDNKYRYYQIIQCIKCGNVKKINKSDKKPITYCKKCNIEQHKQDFVGYENKNYKVIDFDHKNESRRSLFYKVQCKKCNSFSIMRKDAITDDSKCSCLKCKSNGKIPSIQSVKNVYQYYYIDGAKRRNLEWTLTNEEFNNLISKNCYYCGTLPKSIQSLKRYNKTKEEINVQGIDRKNSILGYTIENCVPCCSICNKMKMSLGEDQFINSINKIHNFQITRSTTIENTEKSESE